MSELDARATKAAAASVTSGAQLDRAALSGAAWMGAAKWSTQIISWAGTIIVARILTPQDYGIVAMASVYLALLALVSEFGIGTTIVTQREIEEDQLAQLNVVALILGIGALVFSVLLAVPLGVFFRSEELPAVVIAMSATFAINALQIVPAATLRRELRFRTLALIDLARGFLVPIGTLLFALVGFRYWALVGGAVISSVVSVGITLISRRHGFARPAWASLRNKLRFSAEVLTTRVAWFVYTSADFVVAGRRLGDGPLGEYSLATTVAVAPTSKIYSLLTEVTPALYSAVQDQRPLLRRYFLNMTELLAFVSFPVGIGMSMVAFDLVAVLLGEKWSGVAMPLMLLAAYSVVQGIAPLHGHLFVAVRQSKFTMRTALATAVVLPIAFIVGSNWGTTGIAATWIVVHPFVLLISFAKVREILSLRTRDYVKALRLGMDGAIVMGIAILAIRHSLSLEQPLTRLLVEIPTGALVFTLTTLALHGRRLKEILTWFKRTRSAPTHTQAT